MVHATTLFEVSRGEIHGRQFALFIKFMQCFFKVSATPVSAGHQYKSGSVLKNSYDIFLLYCIFRSLYKISLKFLFWSPISELLKLSRSNFSLHRYATLCYVTLYT